jgi:hypothetical protein
MGCLSARLDGVHIRTDQQWVISMTDNKSTPRPRALQVVRRAARALKPINDQQVLMWEAFWRAGRFPSD